MLLIQSANTCTTNHAFFIGHAYQLHPQLSSGIAEYTYNNEQDIRTAFSAHTLRALVSISYQKSKQQQINLIWDTDL